MLCFLKRVLPFTLTLIVGLAIGSLFNLFSAKPRVEPGVFRLQTADREGGGCRSRTRSYAASYGYSSNYSPAKILLQAEPQYTQEARRNQTEGQVTLRLTLGADGTVKNVEPLTSLPDGLTEKAVKAARMTKFVPATLNGSNIDEVKTITYSFELN